MPSPLDQINWEKVSVAVILGGFILAFIKGWIVAKPTHQHEQQRNKRLMDMLELSLQTLRDRGHRQPEDWRT